MPWVMSTLHTPKGKRIDGTESSYHVYIGAVKIAEIYFSPTATKWKVILRLMRNDVSYDASRHFENMGEALKELHRLLNSPPPEGARVGAGQRPTPVPRHERIEDWQGSSGQPMPYQDPHWGKE